MIDNSVANSRIGVLSKNIKKTIDRQPQNHCTQDKDKYQLIGAEFLHHIGLFDCGFQIVDFGLKKMIDELWIANCELGNFCTQSAIEKFRLPTFIASVLYHLSSDVCPLSSDV
jgi:hypothetical protein